MASLKVATASLPLNKETTASLPLPHNVISDYDKAVISYLGVLMDRLSIANTTFGIWHTGGEKLERIMGRQAIPMVFDYPESNPFCTSTGSAVNQLEWITRYIESESSLPFITTVNHASSGEKDLFRHKQLNAVVTDHRTDGKESVRAALIKHIATVAPTAESPLWRVLASLSELLPAGDDKTQADGLLANRDNLLRESLRTAQPQQRNLF